MKINLKEIDGLRVTEDGQAVLGGSILRLADDLDKLFVHWAGAYGAEEQRYSPLVSAKQLHKLEYFKSFPHQAIFPVSLDRNDENLNDFADDPIAADGHLQMGETSPVHHCLAPAACFPVYMALSGQELAATSFVTLRSTCFRREEHTAPLERQQTFNMREVVCIGPQHDVENFLESFRNRVRSFFDKWSMPVELERATDPFFNAPTNRKYIMQKVAPLKHEMVFNGSLAIGSLNFHQNSFGDTFDISCQGSQIYSGCVAFGIERWLFAFLEHFGTDAARWPRHDALIAD